jgi:hypothetical protein
MLGDAPISPLHPTHGDESRGPFALPTLYNWVYCSQSAAGVDDAAVARIIEQSQRNNPSHGITGLLVFGSGIFFQWLEGPRDNITHLKSVISKDRRHDTIVSLSENEEVRERLFPEWDMELVTDSDILAVLTDALESAEDPKNAEALRRFIQHIDPENLGGSGG